MTAWLTLDVVLAFLAGVGLTGLAAIVKIFADIAALQKAKLEIAKLQREAQEHGFVIQRPTETEVAQYDGRRSAFLARIEQEVSKQITKLVNLVVRFIARW